MVSNFQEKQACLFYYSKIDFLIVNDMKMVNWLVYLTMLKVLRFNEINNKDSVLLLLLYFFLRLLKGQDDYVKPDIDAKTSHLTMIF